jgi:hypothetical protein
MSKFTQFWKSDISKANDEPEPRKIYALTGGPDDRAISNGNSWAESEVKEDKKKPEKKNKSVINDDEDSEKSEKNPVVNGKQTTDEMERYARQHGSYRSDDPRFGDVYEE